MSTTQLDESRKETLHQCLYALDLSCPLSIANYVLDSRSPVIVDTPTRDRAIWAADMYVAGPAARIFLPHGQLSWRNSLLALVARAYPSGKLPAAVNLDLSYRRLSPLLEMYSIYWVLSAWEYLEAFPDNSFRELTISVVTQLLRYYSQNLRSDHLYTSHYPTLDWNWTIPRPRRSILANAQIYSLLQIASRFSLPLPVSLDHFRDSFQSSFWDKRRQAFVDKSGIVWTDANALAITCNLATPAQTSQILDMLTSLTTAHGPLSSTPSPRSLLSWHTHLICPFPTYLFARALVSAGRLVQAREIVTATLAAGLEIARRYHQSTQPEFWKAGGRLFTHPSTRSGQIAVSLCHSWSTFGNLKIT